MNIQTIQYANGDVFVGDWDGLHANPCNGKITYANGDTYEGEFDSETGKYNGVGIQYMDGILLSGTWKQGIYMGDK